MLKLYWIDKIELIIKEIRHWWLDETGVKWIALLPDYIGKLNILIDCYYLAEIIWQIFIYLMQLLNFDKITITVEYIWANSWNFRF